MNKFYNQEIREIIENLKSDSISGLTENEVKQRLDEYGYNQLATGIRKSFLKMFLEQFKSFMIIILLIAAIISGVTGVMEGEGLLDTFVILGILVLNALIGAFQERKAETSLEALKSLAAPITKVLRNGAIREVATRELVPGDIVILETGAVVPADLRLTEAVNLKIQESALTGESVPVEKNTSPLPGDDIALGDRVNMAFSSGTVTYGRGRGIVVGTGMRTEVGKIASMLRETSDTETPMSRRLEQLGKMLGMAALAICAIIFIVGVLYGNSIMSMFMTAVSLAVAAIPEGLPAVSTVVLAIGVQRMVKRNAIIRTLPSVETLGSATVICSDKTGTLTQNKMTVVEAYVNHRKDIINRAAPATVLNPEENRLLAISVLCADAQIRTNGDGKFEFTGDPTETALLDFGTLYNMYKDDVEKKYPRIAEIPFDSERKRMTTVNRMSENTTRINVKGGLDEVLSVCDKIIIEGNVRPIDGDDKARIRQANESMADSALRVLAMAYKDLPEPPQNIHIGDIEDGLIFIGMLGMIDPARPEVIEAVGKCNTAGIRPVMIIGDHKNTAMAIAREIGIYREGDLAITGAELEKMDENDFRKNVPKYSVYARVAPEHKVRIVKAWQSNGEVVAMTGDGVNDAPALKQADIGAAMGIVGTDVAKGAADMVLTDDNFATIVSAVEEGRRIYDNILKAIQFLLSTNVGEIFLLLVTSVFNLGTPLLPIHILWVNLVTDSLPALALSVDPAEENIMNRKPRNSKKGFMTNGIIWPIIMP
jgi:Ca2+-transporting ATPase